MQTAIEPKALRLGILPVTTTLLEDMFCLPEGYHIVHSISYDEQYRILNFTLMSDNLPEVEDNRSLPQLSLHVTCDWLPDQPHEYRKITTEVKIR
jgi:hypothetical protein